MVANYTGYGNAPPSDLISNDYQGSYQEWKARAVASLSANYAAGDQNMLNQFTGATGPIGQPDGNDFGKGTESLQTRQFFERYVDAYGNQDPYMLQQFGPPPGRQATYEANPNSDSALQDKSIAESRYESDQSAATSRYSTDTNAAVTREQIAASQATAAMQDATDRYIAEGNWGVQKYVAELQEKGALDRLTLQLGDNEKDRAQRAAAEQNRHQESMLGLVFQVAQYDSQLAAEPHNWLAYASWLQNRGIVVDGLSLAMAADTVPAQAISPAETTAAPGGNITSLQQAAVQQQAPTTSSAAAAQQQATAGTTSTGTAQQAATQPNAATGQYTVNGVDLNSTDYGAIARQLLGMPATGNPAPTAADLQAASSTFQTSNAGGRVPGFQAYGGPTTNALGMTVQPSGQKDDYRQFAHLLPSQQDMRIGEVESVGRWSPDYLQELQNSRPKGDFQGAASYG